MKQFAATSAHVWAVSTLLLTASAAGLADVCVQYGSGLVEPVAIHNYHEDEVQNSYVFQLTYGQHVYAPNPSGAPGFEVVDIANPAEPYTVTVVGDGWWDFDHGDIGEGHLYGASWRGVSIYDISDPASPVWRANVGFETWVNRIDVERDYLYVATRQRGLVIASLASDPASPVVVGEFPLLAGSVQVFGNLAFVANGTDDKHSLMILDVSDPRNIQLVTDFGGASVDLSYGGNIAIRGSIGYAMSYDGIMVLELSDPSAPQFLGKLPVSWSNDIKILGNALYVTAGDLHVLDITNPSAPTYRGAEDWEWNSNGHYIGFGPDAVVLGTEFLLVLMPYDCLSQSSTTAPAPMIRSLDFVATPNPFNPRTTFRYTLDRPGTVAIRIFDLRGHAVVIIDQGYQGRGEHSVMWAGQDTDGSNVASSTYLAALTVDGELRSTPVKLSLVR